MGTVTLSARPSNGVSFGYKHVILAAEAGASSTQVFLFDFQEDAYDLVATIQLLTVTTGAIKSLVGAKVTYPANGQVELDMAGAISTSAGDIIEVVAQRNTGDTTLSTFGFGSVVAPEFVMPLQLFPTVEGNPNNPNLTPTPLTANVLTPQPVEKATGDTQITSSEYPALNNIGEEEIEGTELVQGAEGSPQ